MKYNYFSLLNITSAADDVWTSVWVFECSFVDNIYTLVW